MIGKISTQGFCFDNEESIVFSPVTAVEQDKIRLRLAPLHPDDLLNRVAVRTVILAEAEPFQQRHDEADFDLLLAIEDSGCDVSEPGVRGGIIVFFAVHTRAWLSTKISNGEYGIGDAQHNPVIALYFPERSGDNQANTCKTCLHLIKPMFLASLMTKVIQESL